MAKGMGLMLVIWGHLLYGGTWGAVNRAIYSFHMPMYFILSGYLYHPHQEPYSAFLKRKSYELLLPTLIFLLLSLPIYMIQEMNGHLTLWQHIERIFFLKGEIAFNAPLWFLIVTFYIVQLSEMLELAKYPVQKKIFVAICSFVGGYLLYRLGVYLPLGWDKLLVCFGFYCLGSAGSHFTFKIHWITAFSMALSSVIWVFTGVIFNDKVSVYGFSFGNYWLFICSGISGSIMWFGLSYLFRRSRFFSYLGQNTILIVCTQYFGVFVVRHVARLLGVEGTMTYNILSLMIAFAALVLYVPVSKIINAYFPWMVGKRRAYANNITQYYRSGEEP